MGETEDHGQIMGETGKMEATENRRIMESWAKRRIMGKYRQKRQAKWRQRRNRRIMESWAKWRQRRRIMGKSWAKQAKWRQQKNRKIIGEMEATEK
jgi:hypothetical protein